MDAAQPAYVLELRQSYLASKGIENLRHVLTPEERAEFIKRVREEFENSEEQRDLQDADVRKGKAGGKGWKSKGATSKGKGTTRGAPQPATASLAAFLRTQKRRRWHRHMQKTFGSKHMWEILASTGRMDPNILRATLQEDVDGQVAEEDVD